jgi:hypothetical protein
MEEQIDGEMGDVYTSGADTSATDEKEQVIEGTAEVVATDPSAEAVVVESSSPKTLTGAVLEQVLLNPTLAAIAYDPDYVTVVKNLMETINVEDHMSIIQFGAGTTQEMIQANIGLFAAIDDLSGSELTTKVVQMQTSFENRIEKLKHNLAAATTERNEQLEKEYGLNRTFLDDLTQAKAISETVQGAKQIAANIGDAVTAPVKKKLAPVTAVVGAVAVPVRWASSVVGAVAETTKKAYLRVTDPHGEKQLARLQADNQKKAEAMLFLIEGNSVDMRLINGQVVETATDFNTLLTLLETYKNRPVALFEKVKEAKEVATNGRLANLLNMIAMREKRGEVDTEITAIRSKGTITLEESDRLALLVRSSELMKEREAGFVQSCLLAQRQMATTDQHMASVADSAMQINISGPQALEMIAAALYDLKVVASTGSTVLLQKICNTAAAKAVTYSDKGFEELLALRKQADAAVYNSRMVLAGSATKTIKTMRDFIEQNEVRRQQTEDACKVMAASARKMMDALAEIEQKRLQELMTGKASPAAVAAATQVKAIQAQAEPIVIAVAPENFATASSEASAQASAQASAVAAPAPKRPTVQDMLAEARAKAATPGGPKPNEP